MHSRPVITSLSTLVLGGLRQMLRRPESTLPLLVSFTVLAATVAGTAIVESSARDHAYLRSLDAAGVAAELRLIEGIARESPGGLPQSDAETEAHMEARWGTFAQRAATAVHRTIGDGVIGGPQVAREDSLIVRSGAALLTLSLLTLETSQTLESGNAPRPIKANDTWDVVATSRTASALGIAPGARFCVALAGNEKQGFCAVLVGLVSEGSTEVGHLQLRVAPAALFAIVASLPSGGIRIESDYRLDPTKQFASDSPTVATAVRALRAQLFNNRDGLLLDSSLDETIDGFDQQWQQARFPLWLVIGDALLLTLFVVLVCVGAVVGARRDALHLWSVRSWSRTQLFALVATEYLLLLVLAGIIGLALAASLAAVVDGNAFSRSVSLAWRPLLVGVFSAGICTLALVALAVWRSGSRRDPPAVRSQPRSLSLLLGVSCVAGLIGARAVASESSRGGVGSANAVAFLLASVGVAAGGLLLAAGVRRAAALLRVDRSPAGYLALVQSQRPTPGDVRTAAALTLAITLAQFGSIFAATMGASASDRAAYASASALRLTFAPDGTEALDRSIGAWVLRTYGRIAIGNREVQVLAVPPDVERTMYWRSDFASASPHALLGELNADDPWGIFVDATRTSLQLWMDGDGFAAQVIARGQSRDGSACTVALGVLQDVGWRQLSAPIVCGRQSWRIRAIEVRALTPSTDAVEHRVSFGPLTAGPAPEAQLEGFASKNLTVPRGGVVTHATDYGDESAWWYQGQGATQLVDVVHASDERIRDGRETVTLPFRLEAGALTLYAAPSLAPLPAIASPGLLAAVGVGEGEPFLLQVGKASMWVAVREVAEHFPSVYPELGDFLIMPVDAVLALLARNDAATYTNEVWISDPSAPAAVTLREAQNVVAAFDRAALTHDAEHEPVREAIGRLLQLGVGAALAMASLALLLHVALLAASRRTTHALLEAQGAEPGIGRQVALRQVALLTAVCATAGTLLGAAFAFALLPVVRFGVSIHDFVPEPLVALAPLSLVLVAVGSVAIGLLIALAALLLWDHWQPAAALRSL